MDGSALLNEAADLHVSALLSKAVDLHVAGDLAGAEAAYRETVAAMPGHAHALTNLGFIAYARGDLAEAVRLYEAAIAANPMSLCAHINLGVALNDQYRFEEAAACYERALAIDPDNADALNNLGDALTNLGRYDDAVERLRAAIARRPDYSMAHTNLGRAYWGQGNNQLAAGELRVAIALDPKDPRPRKNIGMVHLMCGNYAEGWTEFAYRFAADRTAPRPFKMPIWDGLSATASLLVWAEHGPGDEIWQVSMAEDLARANNVVWEVSPRLLALFQRSMPQIRFVARQEPPAEDAVACTAQVPAASLGMLLRRTAESFPRHRRAFLRADPARAAALREQLNLAPGEKLVGVSWLSKNLTFGAKKSTRLADWAPVLATPGCRFVDLQYGDTAAERACASGLIHLDGLDLFDDLDGLAALISLCDAVVTVSNTTAHLAGALGVPTCVLVDAGGGRLWCWGQAGDTTPVWYPAAAIVRRPTGAPWSAAIAAAAAKLQTFLETEI